MYKAGCITQALTALAIALLEEARQVRWDKPVSEYLSGFKTQDETDFGKRALLGDLLAHSAGIPTLPFVIQGKNCSNVSRHVDAEKVFGNVQPISTPRSQWHYNEWSYALLAEVIKKLSHKSWAECVDNIIGRAGLARTYVNHIVDENVALPCHIFGQGAQTEGEDKCTSRRDGLDGSGSIYTCVSDMLTICTLLLRASEFPKLTARTEKTPKIFPVSSNGDTDLSKEMLIRAAWAIQQPQFPYGSPPEDSNMYRMGLHGFKLPTGAFNTVANDRKIMSCYVMGAQSPPRRVLGNTSDLGTSTSTYWIFPETASAVVVLSNCGSVNGEITNIISQVLTQALFDLNPTVDYIEIAGLITSRALASWRETIESWTRTRRDIKARHTSAYIGTYNNASIQMTLSITLVPRPVFPNSRPRMCMRINSLEEQVFILYHYHGDNWTFLPSTRDDCIKQGLIQYVANWKSFIVKFDDFREDEGRCRVVKWFLDPDKRVRPFTFERIQEKEEPGGSPSSVYSQPDSGHASGVYAGSGGSRVGLGSRPCSEETVGTRYSDFIQ